MPMTVEVDHVSQIVRLTIDDQPVIMSLSNWTFCIANPHHVDLSECRRMLDEANGSTAA